jgi:hypothetical protein
MHKTLVLALAALAVAAPRPLLGLDSAVIGDLDIPIVKDLDIDLITKGLGEELPLVSELLDSLELTKDSTPVSNLLTEVEALLHLDALQLPELSTLLADIETLLSLDIPLGLELLEIQHLLTEVEGILDGDLPPLQDLLAKIEELVANLLADVNILGDLPTVQELLLEINGLTEGLSKHGLIIDIENAGIDLLNSQDIVPLENTLSEFSQRDISATPSASKSSASQLPSKSVAPFKGENKGTKFVSTFDDLTPVVGQAAVQDVGPYNGLDYNGINLVELGVFGTVVIGIVPESPPNAGAYGLTTNLLNGAPNMTTKYVGSVTEVFDFDSFFFGCVKGTVESVSLAITYRMSFLY